MCVEGMDFPGGSGRQQNQQQPLPPMTPLPLGRQGSSVYSLTFDEFQSALGGPGKDFGSMNMDELLRSIWTAEESQAKWGEHGPISHLDGGSCRRPPWGSCRSRARLTLTLPHKLSDKTMDEVWRDFVPDSPPGAAGGG